MGTCFIYVDKQAAVIFAHIEFDPLTLLMDPMGIVRKLWAPYFRFGVDHPDETIFLLSLLGQRYFPCVWQNTGRQLFSLFSWYDSRTHGELSPSAPNKHGSAMASCAHLYRYVCQVCGGRVLCPTIKRRRIQCSSSWVPVWPDACGRKHSPQNVPP